jgi:hypothetical protein
MESGFGRVGVATSVSEWCVVHSLTLVATREGCFVVNL